MATLTLDAGTSTKGRSIRTALRMRVNRSAIGSVIISAQILNQIPRRFYTEVIRRLADTQGDAQFPEERFAFFIALGRGHKGDVHALGVRDLVGVDFREHELFA